MRRSFSLATSAVLIASGLHLAMASTAYAAPTCSYRPLLPAKIVVNQSVVGLRVPLAIGGPAACSDVSVSTHLVHGTDDHFLFWLDRQPENDSVYAYSIVPGAYRLSASDCSAYDSDYNSLSCAVASGTTVIKFAGRSSLTAKRVGKKVTLTAKTARFDSFDGSKPTSSRIAIQRLSGKHWRTVKRATTRGKNGYKWTFVTKTKARYRVVAAENSAAFGATSRSVKK